MAEPTITDRANRFWQRVTEGMQLNDIWRQFQSDAQSSYRLYSKDVDATRPQGESKGRHFFRVVGQFFWAILDKLSPARRILLLVALALLIVPISSFSWHYRSTEVSTNAPDLHFLAALLLFALLIMEVGDRVVMKRDLQIAKEIQAWLLPSEPPKVPGLQIAFATRPANTVAGDYYDVFARPVQEGEGPRYLIAVADVAGKSIPAAMLMATFQASLKTLSDTPGPLTELVARINRYACGNSQNGRRFTTAFVAEYEPATRRLTYVNAGHNTPILLRRSGAIERLDVGGVPVGVLEAAPYASGEVTLEVGDWLAAFTDGVVEAENAAQQQYGEDRLVTMLHWGAQLEPALVLQHIFFDIDRFVQNAPQHDDITCMLLRAV
jgi:sigma-B regulation protein RsbU (phosphoserine phosphatase)